MARVRAHHSETNMIETLEDGETVVFLKAIQDFSGKKMTDAQLVYWREVLQGLNATADQIAKGISMWQDATRAGSGLPAARDIRQHVGSVKSLDYQKMKDRERHNPTSAAIERLGTHEQQADKFGMITQLVASGSKVDMERVFRQQAVKAWTDNDEKGATFWNGAAERVRRGETELG